MKRRYSYSISELTMRLIRTAAPIKGYLVISTLASIIGNLSHMGLMGFGAMWILITAGYAEGSAIAYAVLTAVCAGLIALCRYLEGVFSHIGAYGILADLRVHLFEQIARLSPAYMIDRRMGDVLNIAVSDIETLEFFFAHTIGPMFTVIILPVTTICVAAHYSALFAWILVPVYIMISVILPLIALRAGRNIGMKNRQELGSLKALILESVYGIRDIQIFRGAEKKMNDVMKQNDRVNRTAHGLTLHRQTVSALPNFFVYLARILIIAAAGWLAQKTDVSPVGTIIVSFTAAASFSSTFSLTFVVSHLLEAFAAAERLFIIEDSRPVTEEGKAVLEDSVSQLNFEDVTFAYSTGPVILDHVSFSARTGETIGIIGESGEGKSTIMRILLRFYDPVSGVVKLNGTDTRTLTFRSLHSHIAALEQETYLFDASIRENIALADPSASFERIREAARKAGIAEFIESLPEGYETPMGQMGSRLSGGEKQRIGIARVLLADPEVIIMDEPTSSLDVLHEKELLETLRINSENRILIIISHRMSTLTDCTRILKLENGKLSEQK